MSAQTLAALLSAPDRHPELAGQATLLTGEIVSFAGDQAISFTLSEGVSDGQLLGGALSAACTLTLYDPAGAWTRTRTPYGAQVCLSLVLGEESAPLAVFTVTKVSRAEGDGRLILSGSDALGTAFEGEFEDGFVYPLTLGQLAGQIASQAGFSLSVDFPNAEVVIPARPDWGEMTLRQALGHVACAAGCFASISRAGVLEFHRVWPRSAGFSLGPEVTLKREYGERVLGPLTGLSIACYGAPRGERPLVVQEEDTALGVGNCLSLAGNPLLAHGAEQTRTLARGMLSALSGLCLTQARITWRGNPDVCLGTRVRVTDSTGETQEVLVTRQSLTFSRGFSMQSDCTAQPGKTAVGRIFTASGALNAAMLAGSLNGALIRDGSIAARALTAGSVTALQLAAGSVTAEKIGAGAVTAEKIAGGAVTAETLAAGAVTAQSLSAGAVEAEHLAASTLSAVDAHLQTAAIDWANITNLRTAMADIAAAKMDSADIDWARVKDLTTGTAIITKGAGGELYIAKLAVTEANLVSLSVGELLVKGEDGGFYALSVDKEGRIVTSRKQVGNDDVEDVSLDAGEKLIAGSVTAACLNVKDIFADSALIRSLIAANLDVDTLFARQATLQALNAMDITGNQYLKLAVESMETAITQASASASEAQRTADTAEDKANANTQDISGLIVRLNSAEQKITDDSIIGTVKKSDVYDSIQGMRQTAAQQQQLMDALRQDLASKADKAAMAEALFQEREAAVSTVLREMDSKLEQTADSLTFALSQRISEVEATANSLRTEQTEMRKWLRFDDQGLEIGSSADPARLRADNKQLEVPGIKAEKITITRSMAENAQWAWSAGVSGLSLKWIGGET